MTQWGLDTLFNPAKRHMDEEKQRLQSTREEVGDASGGRRIDLESGKVTIRRSAKGEVAVDDDAEVVEDADAAAAVDESEGVIAEADPDGLRDDHSADQTGDDQSEDTPVERDATPPV